MNERIKNAFDSIKAEDELKEKTLDYIAAKADAHPRRSFPAARLVPMLACLVLVILAGGWPQCHHQRGHQSLFGAGSKPF